MVTPSLERTACIPPIALRAAAHHGPLVLSHSEMALVVAQQPVLPPTGPPAPSTGAAGTDEKAVVLYSTYDQLPLVQLTLGERGARDLLSRKLARGFPAFKAWWAATYQDALPNWELRPPNFNRPTTSTDPLLPNPYMQISGEWYQTSFGSEGFKFNVTARNKAHIRQQNMADEPGMRPLRVKMYPGVAERASIGPNPGLYFQTVTMKGMPIGTAAMGFALPWTHVPQRSYDMDAGFAEELAFTRIMEEEIIAWLVLQGEKCVVSQIRYALTPVEDPITGVVKAPMTPSHAYLHFLAYSRKTHPMVDYPPVQRRKVINGKTEWIDEKGTESPFAPQVTYDAQMSQGPLIKKEDRMASLSLVKFVFNRKMTATQAHAFFQNQWANKFQRISVTRPEMRLTVQGSASMVDVEISDDECLCYIGQNTLLSPTVTYKFKPNKKETDEKRHILFEWSGSLQNVQIFGQCTDYGIPGYSTGKVVGPANVPIAVDEDVAEVARTMALQAHQPSSVELVNEEIIETAEAFDKFVEDTMQLYKNKKHADAQKNGQANEGAAPQSSDPDAGRVANAADAAMAALKRIEAKTAPPGGATPQRKPRTRPTIEDMDDPAEKPVADPTVAQQQQQQQQKKSATGADPQPDAQDDAKDGANETDDWVGNDADAPGEDGDAGEEPVAGDKATVDDDLDDVPSQQQQKDLQSAEAEAEAAAAEEEDDADAVVDEDAPAAPSPPPPPPPQPQQKRKQAPSSVSAPRAAAPVAQAAKAAKRARV